MRRLARLAGTALVLHLLLSSAIAAQRVAPFHAPSGSSQRAEIPPPLRLAERLGVNPALSLQPAARAAVDGLEAIAAWNQAGNRPLQNGFARVLPTTARLVLSPELLDASTTGARRPGLAARAGTGSLVWGTAVRVEDAYRLRLHLTDAELPTGARMWVWGQNEQPRAFGVELLGDDGDLWTPSVAGDTIYFEVEIAAADLSRGASSGFDVREVMEIVALDPRGAPSAIAEVGEAIGECVIDGTCIDDELFDEIEPSRKGIALLHFIKSGFSRLCTGGLLNDRGSTETPYLLTANHCIGYQSVTNTLEAFWDYQTAFCGGPFLDVRAAPRSNGGLLLATGVMTDFSLVRLFTVPPSRTFLGWDASPAAVEDDTILHRISHPFGQPQHYSQSNAITAPLAARCSTDREGRPFQDLGKFLYHEDLFGATFPGSSGAPLLIDGGFVVGHMAIGCGPTAPDGCDQSNLEVDGRFAETYKSIASFIDPVLTTKCLANATTLCIDSIPGDTRWKVTARFATALAGGVSGNAVATPLADVNIRQGGIFTFLDPWNPELLVKVLDGCGFNNRFWVFVAATTNVGYTLRVEDTKTGAVRTYLNPDLHRAEPVTDTSAFATCP